MLVHILFENQREGDVVIGTSGTGQPLQIGFGASAAAEQGEFFVRNVREAGFQHIVDVVRTVERRVA